MIPRVRYSGHSNFIPMSRYWLKVIHLTYSLPTDSFPIKSLRVSIINSLLFLLPFLLLILPRNPPLSINLLVFILPLLNTLLQQTFCTIHIKTLTLLCIQPLTHLYIPILVMHLFLLTLIILPLILLLTLLTYLQSQPQNLFLNQSLLLSKGTNLQLLILPVPLVLHMLIQTLSSNKFWIS